MESRVTTLLFHLHLLDPFDLLDPMSMLQLLQCGRQPYHLVTDSKGFESAKTKYEKDQEERRELEWEGIQLRREAHGSDSS